MYRLFIAIPIPERIKKSILSLRANIPGARWMDDDQLHVTLKFIGEVEGHVADSVKNTLRGVRYNPFEMQFQGMGVFPAGGRGYRSSPRVLWTGIGDPGHVSVLRNRIESILSEAGIPRERRKFSPHLTVARLRNPPLQSVKNFLTEYDSFVSGKFTVERFILYSSTLKRSGAVYSIVADYPLTVIDPF